MKPLNLKGRRVCGAKVVEQDGSIQRSRAWTCRCECGELFSRAAGVINQAIKGNPNYTCRMKCGKCRKKGVAHTAEYVYWNRRKGLLCERWQDFETFMRECMSKRTAMFLCSRDDKPIGPSNFYWSARMQSHNETVDECIRILVANGETWPEATRRAHSVSRQRRKQIIARHNRQCVTCFNPSQKHRCDKCAGRTK